jgi:hypothetical protein
MTSRRRHQRTPSPIPNFPNFPRNNCRLELMHKIIRKNDMTTGVVKRLDAAPARIDVFDVPPIIAGEDPSRYAELSARVAAAVRPKDVIEEMLVRDITDHSWEISRLSRMKAALFASGLPGSLLANLIAANIPETKARELAQRFVARDNSAVEQVEQILASNGLSIDAVTAHTMTVRSREFETIERQTADKEARRHVAVRELDRRRSMLAAAEWREKEVVDAEFEDVDPESSANVRPTADVAAGASDDRTLQSPRRPRRRTNGR